MAGGVDLDSVPGYGRYVAACIRRTAALAQGLVTGVREESLTEYTDRVIPRWRKKPDLTLGSEIRLDPVLFERFDYYARRGLELLDSVPRDEPFWQKTNMKATTFKAVSSFHQVLDADPGDAEARWILTALVLAESSGPPYISSRRWSRRIRTSCAGWSTSHVRLRHCKTGHGRGCHHDQLLG